MDLHTARRYPHDGQDATGAENGPSPFTPLRQPNQYLIVRNAPDRTAARFGRLGIHLAILTEIYRDSTGWEAVPLLGDVEVWQGQGGDGLVAQPVEPLRRPA